MSLHTHARAVLDGLGVVQFQDGTRTQDIELRLCDEPDQDPPSLADPVCYLHPEDARKLAEQLLELYQTGRRQLPPHRSQR